MLGGGLAALLIEVLTLKAKVRKANAEAEMAKADAERALAEAESVRITNAENATRILVENIVKPLKDELDATRRELGATRSEVRHLRSALESVKNCPHYNRCPVAYWLRDNQKGGEVRGVGVGGDGGDDSEGGLGDEGKKGDDDGGGAGEQGDDGGGCGEPP